MRRAGTALAILLILGIGLTAFYWRSEAATPDGGAGTAQPVLFQPTRADMQTEAEGAADLPADAGGGAPSVTEGGTYRLSGRYTKTVMIEAEDQIVRLLLDNAEISTNDGPAIYVKSAGKVFITVPAGSESVLSDSAYYTDVTANGAIYSESDVTINGGGRLTITGYRDDAIHTEGELRLIGGSVSLMAKRCGIKANDGMLICPDSLDIASEKQGLVTSRPGQDKKGDIDIVFGHISIVAGDTAIRSAKDIYLMNCRVYMRSAVEDIHADGEAHVDEGCIE